MSVEKLYTAATAALFIVRVAPRSKLTFAEEALVDDGDGVEEQHRAQEECVERQRHGGGRAGAVCRGW
jgi:hypothetical protein